MYAVLMLAIVCLYLSANAEAADKYYTIKNDVKVLAFLGDPNSRRCKPIRYITGIEQKIKLLHNRSGPGVYAFYLEGLLVKDEEGFHVVEEQGYFLARKKYITLIKETN